MKGRDFDYAAFRAWHESVIANYPPEVKLELRRARAKFFKVKE